MILYKPFLFLFFFLTLPSFLLAQEDQEEIDSCPCENCPGLIEDVLEFREYQLNIFNIQNNNLINPDQCVSRVGVKFTHDYVGDLLMELVSPSGITVDLIGQVTSSRGELGQTDNRVFDISFVPNSVPAVPDVGFEPRWDNDQEWAGIGLLEGSYHVYKGDLADFNSGRVNGSWTLRVADFGTDGNDEGELLDFYVEFCDSEGLVCDPCLDPGDTPNCVFGIDAGEATVVPDEEFCLPIYAENVAFLDRMQFPLNWNPSVLQFLKVDSFKTEFLDESQFDLREAGNGTITLNYDHSFDNLGLVVKDSTPIFSVCFKAIGAVGDSSLITVPSGPTAIDIDNTTLLTTSIEGTVKVAVDSTADCIRAIQLCSNEPISIEKSRGPGFEELEACTPDGQEFQSKWFRFDVLESGKLEYMIQPKGAASYGYSLYKGSCSNDPSSENVGCESGFPIIDGRIIGAADNPQGSFGVLDDGMTNFAPSIDVVIGETYFLLVDNFSDNGVGFDLSFAGSAKIGDETIQAIIQDPQILNCTNPTIRLNASASTQGLQYTPVWSTDTGSINTTVGVYEPLVVKGGTFILTISDAVSGCVVKDSVSVLTDMNFPTVMGNNGGTLNCDRPTLELNTIGSSNGSNFAIEWENLTNPIPDLPTTSTLSVDKAGNYELKITDTNNGCFAMDTVQVTEDFVEPVLTAPDNFISCTEPIATLSASSPTEVGIVWSGGSLSGDISSAQVSVSDTGLYRVEITALNGCSTTDFVFVRDERVFPVVEAGLPMTLNCDNPTLALNGSGTDSTAEFTYRWTTKDGQFVPNTELTSLTPTIEKGGLYELVVTNTVNGCVSSDSIEIDTSFINPTIRIESDTILSCFDPTITIDATRSDSGETYEFSWFGGDGNVIDNADTYQPSVTQAGDYIFNVKNIENGCSSSEILSIQSDANAPIADAGAVNTLNCNQTTVTLDGNNSSQGIPFLYSWTTEDGQFLSDTDRITAEVDSAGIYILTVTDTTNGCFATSNVEIAKNFAKPELIIPNDSVLTCQDPSLSLLASSQTPNTTFVWNLPDGTTAPQAEINTQMAGAFEVVATGENGCIATDELTLIAEQILPSIVVEDLEMIDCLNESSVINTENSDQGPNFTIGWTTEDGTFIDENQTNLYNPEVNSGGTYVVEITNTETGCIATRNIEVPSDINRPRIAVNEPIIFTCENNSVPLSVTTDAQNATYQWKLGADVITTTDSFAAQQPGLYSIIVLNTDNNCSSLSSVEITADTIKPLVEAGENLELNCTAGEVALDGSQSDSGTIYRYQWSNQANETLSEEIQVNVTSVGLYNLIVVDQRNGCRSIDTVRVTESRENPIADAGIDTTYCSGVEELDFVLGGGMTSIGNNFTYAWSNLAGTILGDSITQRVAVTDTFVLEVVNRDNNCINTDTVIVFEKPRPVLTLTEEGGINCQQNEIIYLAESDLPNTAIKWVGKEEIEGPQLIVTDALLGESFVAFAEDTTTGCLGTSDVIRVLEDRLPPLMSAGEDTEVNCADTLRLNGQVLSQNIATVINWSTEDGNIVSETSELNPIVDTAGTYILTIENRDNFCVNTDTVFVATNQILPTLSLQEQAILTCNDPEITIKPTELSEGADFYYFWKRGEELISMTDSIEVDLPDTYELMVIDSTNFCIKSAFVEVLDSLNPPIISIDLPDTIDCINNQVVINTNINIENGSYEWFVLQDGGHILGSKNSPDLLVDSAGTYEIMVTNNVTGCVGNRNIQVFDIREKLEIEAGSDKTITCFNDSTVLAAGTIFTEGGHLVFQWTADIPDFQTIDSSLIFTIDQTGTYFLNVRDTLSQCATRDSFLVDRNVEALTFSIGDIPTINCVDEEVIIGDVNDLGQEGYIYQWSTQNGAIKAGEDQPAALVNQAGIYQINIENTLNGCTLQDTIDVIDDKVFPEIDLGQNERELTCVEEELSIGDENGPIGETFKYQWFILNETIIAGATAPTLTVTEAAIYELVVKDTSNNCQSKDTISVIENKNFPAVEIPTNLAFSCSDESLVIESTSMEDSNDLLFIWRTEDGTIISDTDNPSVEVSAPGQYTLEVENTQNSCVSIDNVLVEDNRVLPMVADLEDRMLGCVESDITISAQGSDFGGDIVYEWQDEQGLPLSNNTTLTISQAGTYILQVLNKENNCINTDTFLVTENMNPPTSADFLIESPNCDGADNGYIEVQNVVGGTPPYQYQLDVNEPSFTSLFPDLAPNGYTLTIIDEVFCEWDTIIQLDQPDTVGVKIIQSSEEKLVTGAVGEFTLETSLPPSEIADIIWTPTALFDCTNCEEVSTSFSNSTEIGVTVVDMNGCENTASLFVEVALAAVPNGITPNGDGSNDVFMIPQIEATPDAYPDSELIIFNRWGDVLYKASPYNNDWAGTNNNGDELLEGTYYYVLRLDTREGEFIKGDITILRR